MAAGKQGELHQFEGRDVVGTVVSLTNTGDGLSKAVAVRSVEIRHGEKVYLVVEAEADKVRFDRSKDDPSKLVRVQILKGGTVAIVDFELVAKVLEEQEKKNDEAAGRQRLPFTETPQSTTAERLPGGEPASVASLAEKALEKAAQSKPAPKGRGRKGAGAAQSGQPDGDARPAEDGGE